MTKCECCNELVADDYIYECPVCGRYVCESCYDGEMCDDCRCDFNAGHTIFGE